MFQVNGFLISDNLDSATNGESRVEFSQQEQIALKLFLSSEGGFVDSSTLESEIWGERVVTDNSVRKLISGLRLKFCDKNTITNIRGKGYLLSFDKLSITQPKEKISQKSMYVMVIAVVITILLIILATSINILTSDNGRQVNISTQKVFESSDYIVDYATLDNVLYVTAQSNGTSKLYETRNRQNIILNSAEYTGAYRGIEIHESGKTVLHYVDEDGQCKIKVFEKPVHSQLDEIPCNRQNAFISFDWIDEDQFFVTFNISPSSSIKPYIYNLKSKQLIEPSKFDFTSKDGSRFIDSFIKAHGNGLFSLREDKFDQMSLMYFEGDKQKVIYEYRAKPYSFAITEADLIFVGNNNELLKADVDDVKKNDHFEVELLLPPQTTKIDDPLILENQLYFTLGNYSKVIIRSVSGSFKYSLENGIIDFTYSDGLLSILALTNAGYVIEQLKDNNVINTIYLESDMSFRRIAYFKGAIYIAGGSGVYKLIDNQPVQISDMKTSELASNSECMIAQSSTDVYLFNHNNSDFNKIATQSNRAFASEDGCYFVDKISGFIVNHSGEKLLKTTMNKLVFKHKDKFVHWYSDGNNSHIVDIETGKSIAETKGRILQKRVTSYKDEIIFLGHADIHTSIVKLSSF
ncbi:MAG: helix-turn-helix domain-containing protein [Chromatiaceae bacterium]|nr:helix-turn-helix domain-containing protein [Chromatiaceae bacterium]